MPVTTADRPNPFRYGVALGVTLLALLLRLALNPVLESTSPFLLFALAVMVSAWYGGWGPGLLSTVVGAVLADYFLVRPAQFSHSPELLTRVLLFVAIGVQISWLSGALHRARAAAEREARAARASEQLYRSLADNLPDGAAFLFGPDMRIAVAGGEVLRTAAVGAAPPAAPAAGDGDGTDVPVSGGAGAAAFEGQRLPDVFAPGARASLEPVYRAALEGRRAVEEVEHDAHVYLVHAIPLSFEPESGAGDASGDGARSDGAPRGGGLAVAVDVTERVRAREALRHARDELEKRVEERTAQLQYQKVLLESLIEASLDGILVVSPGRHVAYSNRRFTELWQVQPAATGDAMDDVTRRMRGRLAQGAGDPLPDSDGLRPCPQDGAHRELVLADARTLECYSARVVGDGGPDRGRVWFFRDVTARKRLEREVLEVCEREQRRIGQDLHDGLGQDLTGISLICKGLERRLAARAPEETRAVSEVGGLIARAIGHARDLARGLRPVGLVGEGLVPALRELVRLMSAASQLPVELSADEPPEPPDDAAAVHLYRIVQEAVSNAIRHARPRRVLVTVGQSEGALRVTVEDDGVGVPPGAAGGGGMGLRIMAYRARLLGATIDIRRGERAGTVVEVRLPLAAAERALSRRQHDGELQH